MKQQHNQTVSRKSLLTVMEKKMTAINLNGPSIVSYISHAQAVAKGMTHTAKYTAERQIEAWYRYGHYGEDNYQAPDGSWESEVLSTAIWSDKAFSFRYPVENGTYALLFLVGENHQDYAKNFEIAVEGQKVITIPKMRVGEFEFFYTSVTVSDSQLFAAIRPIGDSEVHLMGVTMTKK